MKTDSPGVGTGPPPHGPGAKQGMRERLEQLSLRVPYRLKLALVWLVIFLILAALFAAAQFDTQWMRDNWVFIIKGIWVTIFISAISIVGAVVLATLGALGRLSKNPIAYGVSGFHTSFFRGTPLIVQMFLIYLALPQVRTNLLDKYPGFPEYLANSLVLDAAIAGTIALGLNYGAYMTEIFRAGIQSVAGGQGEAADALGMRYVQKMRKVVLPQAMRVIIPPTGNEFIAMMKDTALVSFLGVTAASAEMFRRSQLVGKADFRNLEAYIAVAALYWGLTILFTFFQSRLERRLASGYVRMPASLGREHGGGAGAGA